MLRILNLLILLIVVVACGKARPFEQDSTVSAFKYREVYLPEAIGNGADSLGLNTLEEDWAIWGHNLGKVLPEKHSESVYAKVNGATNKSQYCFTSTRLFEYITEFIDNRYGPEDKARFSIIPNDNDVVCLCAKCVEIGNEKDDASPAVYSMVKMLAEKYPHLIFYTSDYRTTRKLPTECMPENTGVMVSAMPYPFSYSSTPEEQNFLNTLHGWRNITNRILVWDYINNFDDYFTPYPILGVMQNRLKNYRDNNVTAVFLNGSGHDASSFSRLKAIVLAELTANPDADWREILLEKANAIYPITGEIVANFILAQEDYLKESGASLPLYEGVPVALRTYLPQDQFNDFIRAISVKRPMTSGPERNSLDRLLAEMALTRLEINRINGNAGDSEELLSQLESLCNWNIPTYSESGWTIDSYVKDYRYLLDNYKETHDKNKLRGTRLVALTPLDPDYSDTSILTDGMLAIPSNYHDGHLITSPEDYTSIAIPNPDGAKKLVVWLSYNTGYKIFLPEVVTLSGQGMKKEIKHPEYPKDMSGHCRLEFDIPSSAKGSLILNLYKEPDSKSMSIEEIVLL